MPDWKKLPELFARAALHPRVVAEVERRHKAGPDEAWCVAFSGGADSLALLLTLWTRWPERRGRLTALHFNHRLRGAESDADEAFCRDVCAGLGVTLRVGAWTDGNPGVSEAEARGGRLEFFKKEMAALKARVLWTGHQKQDIAETLLMRIARGSGAAGLAAPRPVQVWGDGRIFLRPLLALTKAEIVSALRRNGVEWREDASNGGTDFFRNRVRSDVLPAWRDAAENDAVSGAALTRELLDEDDAALEDWLAELLPGGACVYETDTLDLRPLAGKPRALWRRALRRWRPLARLARTGFEEVLALWERGDGRVSAGDGVVAVQAGVLRFTRTGAEAHQIADWSAAGLGAGMRLFLPTGAVLAIEAIAFTTPVCGYIRSGKVDPSREAFLATAETRLEVRPWKAGDRYRQLGATGSAKLQDLFVNRKIPVEIRRRLPVVCLTGGKIAWVPGFPPAEDLKMTDASVTGVHLTYETGTCTVRP